MGRVKKFLKWDVLKWDVLKWDAFIRIENGTRSTPSYMYMYTYAYIIEIIKNFFIPYKPPQYTQSKKFFYDTN
jgi:hypothetical protein